MFDFERSLVILVDLFGAGWKLPSSHCFFLPLLLIKLGKSGLLAPIILLLHILILPLMLLLHKKLLLSKIPCPLLIRRYHDLLFNNRAHMTGFIVMLRWRIVRRRHHPEATRGATGLSRVHITHRVIVVI